MPEIQVKDKLVNVEELGVAYEDLKTEATTSSAGLMSSTDKTKLNGIENGAQVNTVTSVNGDDGDVIIPEATTSSAGLMPATDKTKLSGIEDGAQVNTITGVKGNAESLYRSGDVNITPENLGLGYSTRQGVSSYGSIVYYINGGVCSVKLNVKEIPNNTWAAIATGLPPSPANLYFPVRGNTTGALCTVRITNEGKLEFHGRGTEAACIDTITYVIANS